MNQGMQHSEWDLGKNDRNGSMGVGIKYPSQTKCGQPTIGHGLPREWTSYGISVCCIAFNRGQIWLESKESFMVLVWREGIERRSHRWNVVCTFCACSCKHRRVSSICFFFFTLISLMKYYLEKEREQEMKQKASWDNFHIQFRFSKSSVSHAHLGHM